MNIGPNNP